MLCLDGHWLDGGGCADVDCWLPVVRLNKGFKFKFSRSLVRFAWLGCRSVECEWIQGYKAKDRRCELCPS
jgi:hypothetical protein